jgi:hypothetical protein
MNETNQVFCDRVVSRGLCIRRSQDLNPCDFYLWRNLKDEMCVNNPHTLDELIDNIRVEISHFTREELLSVAGKNFRRCEAMPCSNALWYNFKRNTPFYFGCAHANITLDYACSSANVQIPRLWKNKYFITVFQNPPMCFILTQLNLDHILIIFLIHTLILSNPLYPYLH